MAKRQFFEEFDLQAERAPACLLLMELLQKDSTDAVSPQIVLHYYSFLNNFKFMLN
jgi:hypothetical protein